MDSGKYRVILADPPWYYEALNGDHYVGATQEGHGKRRVRHFEGMRLEQLQALPVRALAAKDAALFMWATMPHLPEALQLFEAWGFTYRTCAFTWTKINRDGSPFAGQGFYTRQNTELCLLGIRGRLQRKAYNVRQVILARRREHSRKPDEQYGRIMALYDGPYLELFARQRWPGWDVWGNQAGKFPAQPYLFGEFPA